MKTIFIGGIQRSGGSLLARLFDGHPDVACYPSEYGFPVNKDIYPIFETYTGIPTSLPSYDSIVGGDLFKAMDIPSSKPEVVLKYGKEKSDPLGVRKNYLEKEYYSVVKTDFDFNKFRSLFSEYTNNAKTLEELYAAKHKAYFSAWDNGKHSGSMEFVLWHSCSGIYLTNIDKYFEEFTDSVFIHPLRDVMGYIASEKTRLARRYYGSRRFPKIKMPNSFVRSFKRYDLEAQIRGWMATLTRVVILQEKFGASNRFLVVRYENLVNNTQSTMKALCEKTGIVYNDTLLDPTIGSLPWGGNSHQGKQKGINKKLASYYKEVLSPQEMETIEKATSGVREYLEKAKNTPVDLTEIPKEYLFDYEYQKKYFDDNEKISLYYALINSGRRKEAIKVPDGTNLLAFLYARVIRIIHVPRMLKLRLFPGWGKQNYT